MSTLGTWQKQRKSTWSKGDVYDIQNVKSFNVINFDKNANSFEHNRSAFCTRTLETYFEIVSSCMVRKTVDIVEKAKAIPYMHEMLATYSLRRRALPKIGL